MRVKMENYFSGDTEFITDAGIRLLSEFNHLDNVKILNKEGQFTEATVIMSNAAPIYEIQLQKGQFLRKTIKTTACSQWLVTYNLQRFFGYKEKYYKTTELPVGKQLINTYPTENLTKFDLQGFLHGVVFGDGTFHKRGNYKDKNCLIALCHESRELKDFFREAGYKLTERDDINQTRIYGLPSNWKNLPNTKEIPYIYSFIMGWFAADGSVSRSGGSVRISSINYEAIKWLQNNSNNCGFSVSSTIKKRSQENTTFGGKDIYILSFIKSTLKPSFFVQNKKQERFKYSAQSSKHWRIKSIKDNNITEPVYSIKEPKTGHFVLSGNILA